MNPENSSLLFHRVVPPREGAAGKHPALIMLHGRGADEEDLLGLSEYLDNRLMVISVRAPYPFSFGGGYMWYEFDRVGTPDPVTFRVSYDKLVDCVLDLTGRYPIDPANIYMLGFSMGTVMSHALALSRPELVRGVIANSGYVPEGTFLEYAWDRLQDLHVFIAHGLHDPVIPVEMGRRARDLYQRTSAQLIYNEYPMGHQISQESLDDMAHWLAQALDRAGG